MNFLRKKYGILAALFPTLLVIDQLTKHEILVRFRLGDTVPVIPGFFNITYVRNTGAAFGLLATAAESFRVPFFLAVPVIALAVITYVFRKIPAGDYRVSSALAMVMSGAVGNLIDRIRFGYVVDFLDFHWNYQVHFPAFNVADSAICVGVGLLMLDLFRPLETGKKHASASV